MSALRWLGLSCTLALSACASKGEGAPSPAPSSSAVESDCSSRADPLSVGLSKLSSDGLRFELTQFSPVMPLQSVTAPGNSWTVSVRDASGNPVTGAALNVTTYMPDHAHSGPPTIGVETADGVYSIDTLLFPMPALYAVTLSLSRTDAPKQSVVIDVCVEAASG